MFILSGCAFYTLSNMGAVGSLRGSCIGSIVGPQRGQSLGVFCSGNLAQYLAINCAALPFMITTCLQTLAQDCLWDGKERSSQFIEMGLKVDRMNVLSLSVIIRWKSYQTG